MAEVPWYFGVIADNSANPLAVEGQHVHSEGGKRHHSVGEKLVNQMDLACMSMDLHFVY